MKELTKVEYVILLGILVIIALLVVLLLKKPAAPDLRETETALRSELQQQRQELNAALSASESRNRQAVEQIARYSRETQDAQTARLGEMERKYLLQAEQSRQSTAQLLAQQQQNTAAQLSQLQESSRQSMEQQRLQTDERLQGMERQLQELRKTNDEKLESIRRTVNESITALQKENTRQLDQIRGTVDEKLQTTLEKRLSESFKLVNDQLEQVYKGLGEMQTLAGDVGGLKKVLSGVKTRGILGEIQLGAILEEILAPEQYETNVATIPGSKERVEYAVKLPGEDGSIYLPIDSKFPGDSYSALAEARESGDKAAVDAAWKQLEATIRSEAKDISQKYVEVPHTTNFGIMFLPFEGLYAEVVNHGLVEVLQREYHVNIAGPSTMAALLNSLQMGFRTLAIQKRSGEVWQVLSAVKTEFDKFEESLRKMQKHLSQTSEDLNYLMTTRTNQINRKLSSVQKLEDDSTARQLLQMDLLPEFGDENE